MSIVKPLLATEAPAPHLIKYPVMASPKLDGIRAIMTKEGPQSRSGKLIPSKKVQADFLTAVTLFPELIGLDGELIVGSPKANDCFRVTTSAVMSVEKNPDFKYYVFDHVGKGAAYGKTSFQNRYDYILTLQKSGMLPSWVVVLLQAEIVDAAALQEIEERYVALGYEGLIIRDPAAAYKHGRSSAKEGILLKVRRFKDSEATILDFVEELENQNEATKDAFGRTERSTHKDNKVGKNSLGSFVVEDVKTKVQFQVGTGYSADDRKLYWRNRHLLKGRIIKYRFFEVGVKDLPRFPVFQGFRDKRDMS